MNLFRALNLGNGKATFYEQRNVSYWFIAAGKLMHCHEGKMFPAAEEACLCNDWIPYVPRETTVNINTLVCGNCQLPSPGKSIVKVTPTGNCVCCDRQIIPPTKTKIKHKEVFEDVIWIQESFSGVVYSYCFTKPLAFKPFQLRGHTKVTIEWEE